MEQENPRETKVMTDEDRHNFDGVTIEERGEDYHVSDVPSSEQSGYSHQQNPYSNENFKVYTLTGDSLLKKLLLGAVIIGVLFLVFLFGGIFLAGFAVVAVIGAIIGLLGGLF